MQAITQLQNTTARPSVRSTGIPSSPLTVPTDRVEFSSGSPAKLNLIPSTLKLNSGKEVGESLTQRTFKETYHSQLYEPRQCGSNIRRLLEKLSDSDELKDARVLGIGNKGFSYFGLVRARHARDTDRHGNARAWDRNWHHHVVLEKDGRIYDFDYGTDPKTPTIDEYFQTMFFDDPDVQADRKKKDYEIQVIDASEYLHRVKDSSVKMRLGEYLGSGPT